MLGNFKFKEDILIACRTLNITEEELAKITDLNFRTVRNNYNNGKKVDILEKIYNSFYKICLRLNVVKSEIYQETLSANEILLFHGSKSSIDELTLTGTRNNCDFGVGFYCSTSYSSSLTFIEPSQNSSVYIFSLKEKVLSILTLQASLERMLIVCFHKGILNQYSNHPLLKETLKLLENKNLIVAPIADNRMFQIMRDFGDGYITDKQVIHALSASRLGNQYILKSEKALDALILKERVYVCELEKLNSISQTTERKIEIDNKLAFARREFRNQGKYIDEVFK